MGLLFGELGSLLFVWPFILWPIKIIIIPAISPKNKNPLIKTKGTFF